MNGPEIDVLGPELYKRVRAAFADEYTVTKFALGYMKSDMHRGILMELLREKERADREG